MSLMPFDCHEQTVALDPRYGSRKTREFVTGGVAGQLLLNSRVLSQTPANQP
jgi:hypothetical protein